MPILPPDISTVADDETVLVVSYPGSVPAHELDIVQKELQAKFPRRHVLVFSHGVEVFTLGQIIQLSRIETKLDKLIEALAADEDPEEVPNMGLDSGTTPPKVDSL